MSHVKVVVVMPTARLSRPCAEGFPRWAKVAVTEFTVVPVAELRPSEQWGLRG